MLLDEAKEHPLCIGLLRVIPVLPFMMEACRYAVGLITVCFTFTHSLMYMAYSGVICP